MKNLSKVSLVLAIIAASAAVGCKQKSTKKSQPTENPTPGTVNVGGSSQTPVGQTTTTAANVVDIRVDGKQSGSNIDLSSSQVSLQITLPSGKTWNDVIVGFKGAAPQGISIAGLSTGNPTLSGTLYGNSQVVTLIARDKALCNSNNGGAQCSIAVDTYGRFTTQVVPNPLYDTEAVYTIRLASAVGTTPNGTIPNGTGTGTGTGFFDGMWNFVSGIGSGIVTGVGAVWDWIMGIFS